MILQIPPELEAEILAEAARRGSDPQEMSLRILRDGCQQRTEPDRGAEGTLADRLKDVIGVLDSGELIPGGAQMSSKTGADFAEGMMEKHRQGHL